MIEDAVGVDTAGVALEGIAYFDVGDHGPAGTGAHAVAVGNAFNGHFGALAVVCFGIDRDGVDHLPGSGGVRPPAVGTTKTAAQCFNVVINEGTDLTGAFYDLYGD